MTKTTYSLACYFTSGLAWQRLALEEPSVVVVVVLYDQLIREVLEADRTADNSNVTISKCYNNCSVEVFCVIMSSTMLSYLLQVVTEQGYMLGLQV